jgi:hypothetical protein
MATTFTERLLIVVRAALQDDANATAVVADPTTSGDTFNVPLVAAGETDPAAPPVAYWAGWTMTPDQRARLLAEFGRKFARAMVVIPAGGQVRRQDDFWLFDRAWNPDAILTALQLQRPVLEE